MVSSKFHRLILRLVCLTILWAGKSVVSIGQQYQFKNYSVTEGLAQSQVYSIMEDSRGYIWMGTRGGGISRFNGLEFTNFTMQEGLSDNYILCFIEDHQNTVWVGSNSGLSRFNGIRFASVDLPVIHSSVDVIFEDRQHRIWLGTSAGLLVKEDSDSLFNPVPMDEFPKGAVNFIKQDSLNRIWVGTNVGIFVLDDHYQLIKRLTRKSGLKSAQVRCMEIDQIGNLWVGTYGEGLMLIQGTKIHSNPEGLASLTDAIISSIFCDSKGMIWISTLEKGLCRYNPQDSTSMFFTEKDGLANNNVKTVLEDQWGNYWIGTSGGGVSKYSGQQFEFYTTKNGLPGNYIYSIWFDQKGEMWLGTSGGGVTHSDSGRYIHYTLDSGFTNAKVKTIYQNEDESIWFGTEGQGLIRFDGTQYTSFDNDDGLGGIWIKDIDGDREGNLWVASSDGGITKISKGKIIDSVQTFNFKRFYVRNGLTSNRINALHIDQTNRVWFASQTSGIGFIQNEREIVAFTDQNGLAGNNVRCITEDRFGNLWIGSSTGLSTLSAKDKNPGQQIRSFTRADGLSSSNIYLIQADDENNIWIGTEKGVERIKVDSGGNLLEIKHFGKDDGFIGVETTQNAVCKDSSGNMWFGTISGLHKYLSQVNIKNEKPPILHFTAVSMNYKPLTRWDSLHFTHDQNQVSFEFLGITQTFPKKINYRYILEGLENQWSPASFKNSVTYSNLKPGSYTFKVLSCNENGIWNDEPRVISFDIAPPVWLETWFIVTVSLLILFLIGLTITVQVRIATRKARARQEKLKLERDLIAVEQKALRLQMNPHFIFNSLNSIQSLIATGDELGARKNLSGFSKLMRQILENSRKNKITLEEEISTLQNYLTLEKECNDGKFDFEFIIEPDMETELIEIPPMIVQPFVENAIKHGMSEQLESGKISIEFKLENDQLVHCIVRDNGIGRMRAAEKKRESKTTHKSTAMDVTEERLGLLEKDTGSIQIIDLQDEINGTNGTEVHVRIPVSS